jgi:hypothetical protein
MDAGLAAVSGAIAGAVATVGAAFVNGWTQRQGTLLTIKAADRKDLREPRLDAYGTFLSCVTNLLRLAKHGEGDRVRTLKAMQAAVDRLDELYPIIAMRSPRDVRDHAERINAGAKDLYDFYFNTEFKDGAGDSARGAADEALKLDFYMRLLHKSRDEFLDAAQKVLSDDDRAHRG